MKIHRKTLGACALISIAVAAGVAYTVSTAHRLQLERLIRAAAGESGYERKHPRRR